MFRVSDALLFIIGSLERIWREPTSSLAYAARKEISSLAQLWVIGAGILGANLQTGLAASSEPDAIPLDKRWMFVWRDLKDPKEVERMIGRFPEAAAHGYNGVAFSYDIASEMAPKLRASAREYGLDLVAIVMGNAHDRNYVEGVLSQDVLFVAQGNELRFQPDTATRLTNGDFEAFDVNHFQGWSMQDDEGLTTFVDREVRHGGNASLRMENIRKNEHQHCRLAQPIRLQPHRQYRISFWVKTENLFPTDAEVKVLTKDTGRAISFQTFRVQPTQDWKHYDLVFNSLAEAEGRLYLGSWSGRQGKLWWDDFALEEIGLVNVIRRPGCPVTVRAETGVKYEEGRDYVKLVDPQFHPWVAYHEPPKVKLPEGTRIPDGARVRVSYYHPLIVYEDRVTSCISEPRIFKDWAEEVKRANELFHPSAFLMSHDEMRVLNQCELCQSKRLSAGQLLAWNVRQAAQIIRDLRPDAEIWVWSDMFDPLHNAVEHYYAVNGSLAGSWEGLDKNIGIVNWYGELKGNNCQFFAERGLRQILSGYYDSDEDGSAISLWRANTKKIPGIVGAMYTTWEDKYGALGTWADKAWGGRASRKTHSDSSKQTETEGNQDKEKTGAR